MRRLTLILAFGCCALVLAGLSAPPPAQAFWHRRQASAVVVQTVCVPVYVPVYMPGGGDGRRDANTPKVHFLLVFDTEDKSAGAEIRSALTDISPLYESLPPENRGEVTRLRGKEEINRAAIEKALTDMPVLNGKDTLVVYCMVHGEVKEVPKDDKGVAQYKRGAVEQDLLMNKEMTSKDGQPEKFPRTDLVNLIKTKNPRLGVLITDSCFQSKAQKKLGFPKLSSEEEDLSIPKDKDLLPIPKVDKRSNAIVFYDLFVNHNGQGEILNINSADGEREFKDATGKVIAQGELAMAGVFSTSFVEHLYGWNPGTDDARWSDFIPKRLAPRVAERFKEGNKNVPAQMLDKQMGQNTQTVFNFNKGKPTEYPVYSRIEDEAGGAAGAGAPVRPTRGDADLLLPQDLKSDPKSDQLSMPKLDLSFAEPKSPAAETATAQASPASAPGAAPTPEPLGEGTALLTIMTTPGAKVYVNNLALVTNDGKTLLQATSLVPGKAREYELRTEVIENGKTVTHSKKVAVLAGQDQTIDLGKPVVAAAPAPVRPTAEVKLKVPAGATVTFNDTSTGLTTADQTIRTPPLQAGEKYYMTIDVRWTADGKPQTASKKLILTAGQDVNLDFTNTTVASR